MAPIIPACGQGPCPADHAEDNAVKILTRLPVFAMVAATGLVLAATAAAAAPAVPGAGHGAAVTSGTKLWEARYAASGRGAFSLASAVSPDGSALFLTGGARRKVHESGAPSAGATLAYNPATGAKLWQANYNPGGLSTSSFSAIAVSPDSSTVFVAGTTQPKVDGPSSVVVAAYDAATGVARWTDTTAIAGEGTSIAVSPDGSAVYVTGGGATVAFNAATGAPLWTETLAAQAFTANVAVSPDGSTVFVRGVIGGSSEVVAAYDAATGASAWTTTLVRIAAQSLAVSPDGSTVFVTGEFGGSPGTGTDFARTAALDAATGNVLWAKTSKSPNGGSYGNAVTVSPDSSTVFVTGSTTTASHHEVGATWAYDAATGATLWLKTLPGLIFTNEIAVSPDGSTVFAAKARPPAARSSSPRSPTTPPPGPWPGWRATGIPRRTPSA
jgi:outer membrane protein assembly factor BamB